MNWLTQSFKELSIAWLLISGGLGGVVGAAITFFFEDTLRHITAERREKRKLFLRYRNPLLQTAISLERQINTILRSRGEDWLTDEYYRMSVFYRFGAFLFWVNRIEQETGFLDMRSSERSRAFTRRLYAPFAGFSSIRRYNLDSRTAMQRDMLRAIGEEMCGSQAGDQLVAPIGFAAFVRKYGSDAQFTVWFSSIDDMLAQMSKAPGPGHIDRLVVAGVHLQLLASYLDSAQAYAKSGIDNIEMIERKDVRDALEKDVADARVS